MAPRAALSAEPSDESLLQKLSSTPSEQLRPEFVQQMGKLRSTIMN